jgi:hypothetical protein
MGSIKPLRKVFNAPNWSKIKKKTHIKAKRKLHGNEIIELNSKIKFNHEIINHTGLAVYLYICEKQMQKAIYVRKKVFSEFDRQVQRKRDAD